MISKKRFYKSKSKIDTQYKGFKGFENVWNNRNVCAYPNIGWHLDATFLNIYLEGQPKSKHFVFVAIDPATNKFVFAKTFQMARNP